ncbi:helix-turn-helix domain-containing protein [Dactylosporangium sp. CA-052675]|uniref:helix-turn-helix domain-containing protein n=1 Tax=Dactylosporangium sp. CA-052675 TaxID=3239927 RepID=UPI003D8D97C6
MSGIPDGPCFTGPQLLSQLQRLDRLTGREREVLVLLPSGAANREIAGRLGITERTVKAHVTSIIAKLEVCSRVRAAVIAFAFIHDSAAGCACTKVQ